MNLKNLNESFDKKYSVNEESSSVLNESSVMNDLAKALFDKLHSLEDNYESNIKVYEHAFQDVIEKQFPEKSWWEVTDCNIFWSLFNGRDPEATVIEILKGIKPEFKDNKVEESISEYTSQTSDDIAKRVVIKDEIKKKFIDWAIKNDKVPKDYLLLQLT